MRPIVTDVPCSMYLSIGVRGVVVNFDLGERFPRTVSPPPAGNFFEIFDAKSRVWRQFGPENKLIECQPNEYDVICRNASVLAFHLRPTIFAGAPFRIQNICLNGVPPRSRTTTPLNSVCLCVCLLDITALVVPPVHRSTLGDRAFRVDAPRAWNSLPSTVPATLLLLAFRRQLKTLLFRPY